MDGETWEKCKIGLFRPEDMLRSLSLLSMLVAGNLILILSGFRTSYLCYRVAVTWSIRRENNCDLNLIKRKST